MKTLIHQGDFMSIRKRRRGGCKITRLVDPRAGNGLF
jgi:hypothetical protein